MRVLVIVNNRRLPFKEVFEDRGYDAEVKIIPDDTKDRSVELREYITDYVERVHPDVIWTDLSSVDTQAVIALNLAPAAVFCANFTLFSDAAIAYKAFLRGVYLYQIQEQLLDAVAAFKTHADTFDAEVPPSRRLASFPLFIERFRQVERLLIKTPEAAAILGPQKPPRPIEIGDEVYLDSGLFDFTFEVEDIVGERVYLASDISCTRDALYYRERRTYTGFVVDFEDTQFEETAEET